TQDTASDQQRQRWLATAAGVVEHRVDAIVTNKHRGAYARAAALVVAYAETLAVTGASTGAGLDHVSAVRQRYPRHTAFRTELDAATSASTLLTPRRGPLPARAARNHPRRP
ncbi:MAG TPA: hypothetical protein VHN80_20900, partial [Kineosporiaceae bacterium]|nr:hypothetical protein [Kineosporiaceae bacterium]